MDKNLIYSLLLYNIYYKIFIITAHHSIFFSFHKQNSKFA